MRRTTYVVASANPLYALFLFRLFNYIYVKPKGKQKPSTCRTGAHRDWKRAPIRDRHCRVKGESREKGRQKFLLFRALYTPVYAYGKALFRFFRFPFHGRLRRLSVYSARKREASRTHHAALSKREKYLTGQSIFRGRKHEVFRDTSHARCLFSRHESKLYRDTARLLPAAIEKALLLFKNVIINKTWS